MKWTSGKRGLVTLFLIALAVVMAMLSLMGAGAERVEAVSDVAPVMQVGPKVPYLSFLTVSDLEVDKWYVLIDLDDAANSPHARTGSINLKQIVQAGVLSEATHWDIQFGVVGTVSTSTTHIEWIHRDHRVRSTQWHTNWFLPEHGINLTVRDDGTLMFVATASYTDTVFITSSTSLSSTISSGGVVTTTPEVGDLIMFVEEIETGGYLTHLSVGVLYNTQR